MGNNQDKQFSLENLSSQAQYTDSRVIKKETCNQSPSIQLTALMTSNFFFFSLSCSCRLCAASAFWSACIIDSQATQSAIL